jgi:hypothetical protein
VFPGQRAYTFTGPPKAPDGYSCRNVAVVEVAMAGIVALTVISMVVLSGLIVAVHTGRAAGGPSARRGCIDRELASMVDRGMTELLADRLTAGPLLVPVRIGHRLLGPFLLVDTGTSYLRLQLYNENRRPEAPVGARGGLARLRAISYTDGQGWRFVFDGPRGPQRYLGWLVETLERRGPAFA